MKKQPQSKLMINFRGLMALAPVGRNYWRALLVNALKASVSTLNSMEMIERHFPYIAIPVSLLDSASIQKAQLMVKPHFHTEAQDPPMSAQEFHAVYFLPHHEIALTVKTSTSLNVQAMPLGSADPSSGDKYSVRWTSDLSVLRKDAAKVRPDLVNVNAEPPIDTVSAYMDIRKGTVSVGAIQGAGAPDAHHQFLNADVSGSRALGFETVISMDLDAVPSIVLRSRLRGEKPVTLTFKSADMYMLLIDNSTLFDLTQVVRAMPVIREPILGPYYHYEAMYKLSEKQPKKIMVPVPPLSNVLDPPIVKCSPTSLLKK